MFKKILLKFHRSKLGMETLQVVAIIAIAAIVALGIFTLKDKIFGWSNKATDEIIQKK